MDGEWIKQRVSWQPGERDRYRLQLPPLFDAEVFFKDGCWQAVVNNKSAGGYPTPE